MRSRETRFASPNTRACSQAKQKCIEELQFYLKDDHNGKVWLEVIFDHFLDPTAVTVVVTTESE